MGRLVLASTSPRRADLCALAGLDVEIVAPEGAEPPARPGEDPAHYVQRAALAKAESVARRLKKRGTRAWIIGADTVVVADKLAIFGKPSGAADARRMVRRLIGRTHHVVTGLCVTRDGGPRRSKSVDTLVAFRPAEDAEIDAYLATGEWRDKAGAYAVQGAAGARFVTAIYGSYTNVVGLPVVELVELLRDLDVL